MVEVAVETTAESERVTHADEPPPSATGPELAAANKCAYNQHKDLAPSGAKPVRRRTILIARSFDPANKRAEKVAEALVRNGYQTLGDLMYKSKAELKADLKIDASSIEAYAEGLKKFYFYLPD